MYKRIVSLALTVAVTLLGASAIPAAAQTPQTATPTYCTPPNSINTSQNPKTNAPLIMGNDIYDAICGGNPGDLWKDGAFYNPVFSYTSDSLDFVFPRNVWYATGKRVYTDMANWTAPINTTSYWWIDTALAPASHFKSTTVNIPPTPTSVLEYTIVTDMFGITSVTFPGIVKLKVPGLAPSSNMCTDVDAEVTTLGCTGGGGGGVTGITPGTGINVSGSSSSPTVAISPLPLPPSLGGTGSVGPAPSAVLPVVQTGSFPNPIYSLPALANVADVGTAPYSAPCSNAAVNSSSAVNAAITAINAVNGGTVILHGGCTYYGNFVNPGSNTLIMAIGGPGYPGGSSKFPTVVPATATLSCFNASSNPVLTVYPSLPVEAAGDGVSGINFDSHGGLCPVGLYVAGEKAFRADHISGQHFLTAVFSFEGKYLSDGTSDGSVGHMTGSDWSCNQAGHIGGGQGGGQSYNDGACFIFNGHNTGNQGDVYMASVKGISATNYATPCFDFKRSDANIVTDVQCKSLGTPSNQIGAIFECGSQSNQLNNFLSDQYILVYGTEDGCVQAGTQDTKPASGTVLEHVYQSDGSGPAPVFDTGANGVWSDDNGNRHYVNGLGTNAPFPYIGWGNVYKGYKIGPDPISGVPFYSSDGTGLVMGVAGNQGAQCGHLYFSPSGVSTLKSGFTYDSYLGCPTDPVGAGGLTFPGSTTQYGPVSLVVGPAVFPNLGPTCFADPLNTFPTNVTYYTKIVGYTYAGGSTGIKSEKTVTCDPDTLLQVRSPGGVVGIKTWSVYASLATGTEQLQTTANNLAIGTDWVMPTSGITGGATPPPSTDTTNAGISTNKLQATSLAPSTYVCTDASSFLATSGCPSLSASAGYEYDYNTGFHTNTFAVTGYVQWGSTISDTTGTSTGPQGKWHLHVEFPLTQDAAATNQNSYGCIQMAVSGAIVYQGGSQYNHTLVCKTAPAGGNSLAGTAQFGNTANGGGQGLSGYASADVYINNATPWSVTFWVNAEGSVSQNINGYGHITVKAI